MKPIAKLFITLLLLSLFSLSLLKRKFKTKGGKKIFESCSKSKECESELVCAHDEGEDIKKCEETKCQEVRKFGYKCLKRSNAKCEKANECYNNECIEGRCKVSAKQFLGDCTYHYFKEECAENSYCTKTDKGYKCLGGADHPCEHNFECYNNSCGLGKFGPKSCNSFAEKAMKNSVSWAFADVNFKKIIFGNKK